MSCDGAPVKQTRVLVVEDEPRMRQVLQQAIGSWGFAVETAATAEEALRLTTGGTYSILLLDLNLPGMSGIDLLQRLREQKSDIQAIILTGFGDLESARKAIHLDVVEFLTKPCHLGELEQALEKARRRLSPPMPVVQPEPALPPPAQAVTLDDLERKHILEALARNRGNRAATAAELGISLRTLYYRLAEYQKKGYSVD